MQSGEDVLLNAFENFKLRVDLVRKAGVRKKGNKYSDIRIIVTGGGTGGHLFPAIAVAEEFDRRFADSEICFVGTGKILDKRALSGRGFAASAIHCGGLKGGSFFSILKSLVLLPFGLFEALIILKKFHPDLVFGVGGYVTGPVVLAAKILGIPACIHEQNSVPGMANRKLGRFVDRVFLTIPGSEKYFNADCSLLGNPVRREFLRLRDENKTGGRSKKEKDSFTLTVVGGSQGAHQLNCLVPEALAVVKKKLPAKFKVIHQTGAADREMVQAAYAAAALEARVEAFYDNMAEILNGSDLLVCRAGATTLAEITVLGKPAILVPFPYAADDHQSKNGVFMVKGGAALMFNQQDLTPKVLGEQIADLCADREKREEMSLCSGNLAKPEAAARIVDECVQLVEKKSGVFFG